MTKPEYGIDAPNVVRNLLLFSLAALILTDMSFELKKSLWVALYFASIALSLFATGCWMIYSTRVVKPRLLSRLIDEIGLQGHEKILDVGCGRGMLLIEAAKRVPSGRVCGIDLWSRKDQSGNAMDQTLANAELEQVGSRIEIQTADMRSIPYPDGSFDVVVSSLAIHNVPKEEGRKQALFEILRVLKQGGTFLILDIHYAKHYARFLQESNAAEILSSYPFYSYCPMIRAVKGIKK